MIGHPGSLDGRTTKTCWNVIKDRYGKPVLTPICGADATESGCPGMVQSSRMTATEGHTPRKETMLKTSWLKNMDNNRFEQPLQPPVRRADVTLPDQTTVKERREMTAEAIIFTDATDGKIPAGCQMPLNDVTIDRSWHKVMKKNQYVKPIWTQDSRTVVRENDDFETNREMKTVGADRYADPDTTVRPDGGPVGTLTAGGPGTDDTNIRGGRCMNCHKKKRRLGTVRTNGGDSRKPLSGLLPPIVNKSTPTEGTGAMHYQWIMRESVMKTEMTMPSNYLEIPELKIPKLFLHLAEEARDVEVNNDPSGYSEEVKSQVTELPGPILVTVITNGQPMPFGKELVNDVVSAEMMTDAGHVGRCSPIDQASQVVSPDTTEHPIRLGLITDGRRTASADTGGLDVSWDEQEEPIDGLGSVVLLGSGMCENVTAPVIPVGQDVHLTRRDGPVDRSCPVGTQRMTEPSVLLRLKTDWMEDAAVGPVGPDGNSSEQGEAGHRPDPAGSRRGTDRPVLTEKRGDTHNCPVGLEVLLAEGKKTLNRPDPVGQHSLCLSEQSVFLQHSLSSSIRCRPGGAHSH